MAISIKIEDLGIIKYQDAWDKQRKVQSELISGSNSEAILFCEHPLVLTYGSSSELSEVLLSSQEVLAHKGVEIIKTDRGGNITSHGPGQLVTYLILDLKKRRQDVSWYLRSLEDSIIELLLSYKIEAMTIPSQTGVWFSKNEKICSIGIRISRWCTMHGLALNISSVSEIGFKDIIPCGIGGARAISIEAINGKIPSRNELISSLSSILLRKFFEDFSLSYQTI